jgi:hypothetical protein
MIAIPTYPYDIHSVWNRNQLGDVSATDILSNPMLMIAIAAVGYFIYTGEIKF